VTVSSSDEGTSYWVCTACNQPTDAMSTTDRPLWAVMRDAFYDATVELGYPEPGYAAELRAIAAVVERRGMEGLDLDPDETADWLRAEAAKAEGKQ
jgi:hypothetical protein